MFHDSKPTRYTLCMPVPQCNCQRRVYSFFCYLGSLWICTFHHGIMGRPLIHPREWGFEGLVVQRLFGGVGFSFDRIFGSSFFFLLHIWRIDTRPQRLTNGSPEAIPVSKRNLLFQGLIFQVNQPLNFSWCANSYFCTEMLPCWSDFWSVQLFLFHHSLQNLVRIDTACHNKNPLGISGRWPLRRHHLNGIQQVWELKDGGDITEYQVRSPAPAFWGVGVPTGIELKGVIFFKVAETTKKNWLVGSDKFFLLNLLYFIFCSLPSQFCHVSRTPEENRQPHGAKSRSKFSDVFDRKTRQHLRRNSCVVLCDTF